jgi:hypothetical protein
MKASREGQKSIGLITSEDDCIGVGPLASSIG